MLRIPRSLALENNSSCCISISTCPGARETVRFNFPHRLAIVLLQVRTAYQEIVLQAGIGSIARRIGYCSPYSARLPVNTAIFRGDSLKSGSSHLSRCKGFVRGRCAGRFAATMQSTCMNRWLSRTRAGIGS